MKRTFRLALVGCGAAAMASTTAIAFFATLRPDHPNHINLSLGPLPWKECRLQDAIVVKTVSVAEERLPTAWSIWTYNNWFVSYRPNDCHSLTREIFYGVPKP